MGEKKSTVNKFIILLALLAVTAMIVLLVVLQKHQDEKLDELQQQGQQMSEQRRETERQEAAQQMVRLRRLEEGSVYLWNCGDETAELTGFLVAVDGVTVKEFSEKTVLEPQQELAVALQRQQQSVNAVIALYGEDGSLLERCAAGSLAVLPGAPVFSVPGGFYADELTVELSAPEGMTIYYTTDGTVPTTESTRYEEPVAITSALGKKPVYAANTSISQAYIVPSEVDKCTVVQAIAVDGKGRQSEVSGAVYFCRMDEKLAYRNMPVLSLSAAPEELFDYYKGIYVMGRTYEDALARGESTLGVGNYALGRHIEAELTYFEADRGLTYQAKVECSVVPDSAASTAQKNLRIEASGTAAGSGSTLSAYLPENGSAMFLDKGGEDYILKLRQLLAQELLSDSAFLVEELQPCALFLNGEFWGIYLMRTEDPVYAAAKHYGVAVDSVELVDTGSIDGEPTEAQREFAALCSFIAENDMSVQKNYETAAAQLDMESYIEYLCANLYLANNGWNEAYVVFRFGEDARWRFLLRDCGGSAAANAYSTYSIDTFLRPEVTEHAMLRSLMRNETFSQAMQDTMEKMAGECFDAQKAAAALDALGDLYERGVIASQNRYTQGFLENSYDARIEEIKEFFERRADFVQTYLQEFREPKEDGSNQ